MAVIRPAILILPFKDWVLPAAIERVRRKLASADDGNRQMVDILNAVLTDGLPAVEAACAEAIARAAAGFFDLSPAEARLASQITEGRSIEQIALSTELCHNTIRSQLKSVFHKTGVQREAELVGLLGVKIK